jgi:SagB-type dehydrogenase family enzyme
MDERQVVRSVVLPAVRRDAAIESVLGERRSVREFSPAALRLSEVAWLLWAGQGIVGQQGRRTAPSAGGLHPLELYVLAGAVDGLSAAVYHYAVTEHELEEVIPGDPRPALAAAALGQEFLAKAPATIVIAGDVQRTASKYGDRAVRYVHMEVGAVAQNISLQAAALELGCVFVGAFADSRVKKVLGLPGTERPLGLMPVGRPAG